MLNKKGQTEDAIEVCITLVLIVIGIIAISILHADYTFSLKNAKSVLFADGETVTAYDTTFIGLDLLNTLRLPVTKETTIGELLVSLPQNYPDIQDPLDTGLIVQYPNNRLGCGDTFFASLSAYLTPVYGEQWFLSVFEGDEMIFFCTPIVAEYAKVRSANMTLPSVSTDEKTRVVLEVYI